MPSLRLTAEEGSTCQNVIRLYLTLACHDTCIGLRFLSPSCDEAFAMSVMRDDELHMQWTPMQDANKFNGLQVHGGWWSKSAKILVET